MKKVVALTISLPLAVTISAQDESSGDSPKMWLGGKVTFGAMSARDFTRGPSFGIMLNDNMGVGGTLMFSGGNNSNAWNLEPYFRYYIPIVDKFAFFGDAFIGIGGGDNDTSADGGDFNTLNFGARAGLQFWFTPKWSMAASNNVFIYQSTNGNGKFGAGVDFSTVNFSFFFHF